jgi:hypothetical protein
MTKTQREALAAAGAVLDAAGVKWRHAAGGKHLCVITDGGHKFAISGSPKNRDGEINHARQRAQRVVRMRAEVCVR